MTRSFFKILKMSAAGLVGAIGVLAVTLKQTIGYGLKIRQEMASTGRSAEHVLKVREAFRLVGVEGDEVVGIMDDMMERFNDFRFGGTPDFGRSLKQIGLTFDDLFELTDGGNNPARMFDIIMKAVESANLSASALEDVMDKIFGGKAMELSDLGKNFSMHMATAKKNTEGLAESLERESDRMQQLHVAWGKLRASFQKLGLEIVSLLPIEKIAGVLDSIDFKALFDPEVWKNTWTWIREEAAGLWNTLSEKMGKWWDSQISKLLGAFDGIGEMFRDILPTWLQKTKPKPNPGLNLRFPVEKTPGGIFLPKPGGQVYDASKDNGKKIDETNDLLSSIHRNMNKGASFA